MTKKLLILLAFVLLLLVGCNANSSKLYKFDNSTLKSQVKDLEFIPKLPSKLPFENVKATFSSPPDQGDLQTFDFFTSGKGNNNFLELLVINNKEGFSGSKFEEVKIGEIKGKYFKKTQTLRWKDKNLEYSLMYHGEQSDKKLSKEDLIETAKSFE
jgi:hypothetical protein